MKITGITAEYNPFHNGHAYLIREARRVTCCDAVAVVMSGDFVQRGEPAFTDKHTRACHALKNGADLVFPDGVEVANHHVLRRMEQALNDGQRAVLRD